MPRRPLLPLVLVIVLLSNLGCAARSSRAQPSPARAASDSTTGTPRSPARTGPQPYDKVIPKGATADTGLFLVHRGDGKVLWEIPDSLLGRDMLWLTRIAAAAEDLSPFTNAGSNVHEYLVRFERDGDRILLRSPGTRYVADTTLPIAQSVAANTFAPILRSFKLEGWTPDSGADRKSVV